MDFKYPNLYNKIPNASMYIIITITGIVITIFLSNFIIPFMLLLIFIFYTEYTSNNTTYYHCLLSSCKYFTYCIYYIYKNHFLIFNIVLEKESNLLTPFLRL